VLTHKMSNFNTLLANARAAMESHDFRPDLWVPEFGWSPAERDASEDPFEPQLLAALQTFLWCYTDGLMTPDKRIWVHLAAEMQAGKTGVINALIRLVLANRSLKLTPDRCFVLTGMSDEAWQTQTEKRMPACVRHNVHHAGTLSHVKAKLEALAEASPDKILSDILITLDESHYASSARNQPAKYVYGVVASLCPRSQWCERNIRFVTVSATDPAKVLAMQGSEMPTAVVRLLTSDAYQSVEKLLLAGRIRPVEASGTLHSEAGFLAFKEEVERLESVHGPLTHILRPNHGKTEDVELLIGRDFPEADVVCWDVESNKKRIRDTGSTSSMSSDINASQLSEKPSRTRFILLKGMFRAAKTMDDTHVGVLFDRVGGQDATNLQSLLGRACGYGKSKRTVVFTSSATVNTYLKLWKELCASKHFSAVVTGVPVAKLRGKMPGVTAAGTSIRATLAPTQATACPLGSGTDIPSVAAASAARRDVNEDDFEVKWSEEFHTLAEAKAHGAGAMKPDASGFFKNATGAKGPMTKAQLLKVQGGKKTAHSREHPFAVNQVSKRTFAYYEDLLDTSSVRFIVRTLTRVRDSLAV